MKRILLRLIQILIKKNYYQFINKKTVYGGDKMYLNISKLQNVLKYKQAAIRL